MKKFVENYLLRLPSKKSKAEQMATFNLEYTPDQTVGNCHIDLTAFCRICLTKSNSSMPQIPLTAEIIKYNNPLEDIDEHRLSGCKALEDIVGEKIEKVNAYACGICSVCLVQLESAYELKRQYFKSKAILEKAYKSRDYSDLPNENIVDIDLTSLLNGDHVEDSSDNEQAAEIKKKPYFLRKTAPKTPEVQKVKKNAEIKSQDVLGKKLEKVEKELPTVELVSGQASYDIKDIMLIDQTPEEYENQFRGFLDNINSNAVTASYVNKPSAAKTPTITELNVKAKKSENEIMALSADAVEEMGNLAPIKALASQPTKMSFLCRYCKANFQSSSYLKRHMPICAKFQNLECYLCEKKHRTMRELVAHVKQHNKPKKKRVCDMKGPVTCEVCFKVVDNRRRMYYHMRAHREKQFICEECGRLCGNRSKLREHINNIHKRKTTEVCPICAKTFTYTRGLSSHIRIHTEEFKYECQYCSKKFRHLYSKTTHELGHTGDKPLKCQFCEKPFRKHIDRLKHERRIHTGDRPFKCEVCGEAFITGVLRNRHLLQHEGPFECLDCGKGFFNIKILRVHLKKFHNITEISDPIRMSEMTMQ